MPRWDPTTYLRYRDERTRPFLDLVSAIEVDATSIVDVGCGPGHLSAVLRARWPDAEIVGIDSSPDMIDAAVAQNDDPQVTYELADVARWEPEERPQLIVSNAAFQWVPNQLDVIARLVDMVASNGAFAFSVPANFDAPSHVILHDLSARAPYEQHLVDVDVPNGVPTEAYLDLLAGPRWRLDVWETTYLHLLPGEDAVFDWISGTGARPVLQALPEGVREAFVVEYKAALRAAYPRRAYGTLLPFKRAFVIASRS